MDSREFGDLLASGKCAGDILDALDAGAAARDREERLRYETKDEKIKRLENELSSQKSHSEHLERENRRLSSDVGYACSISCFFGSLCVCLAGARDILPSYTASGWLVFVVGSFLLSLFASVFFGSALYAIFFSNLLSSPSGDRRPFFRDRFICLGIVAFIFIILSMFGG